MATIKSQYYLFDESSGKYKQVYFETLAELVITESGETLEEALTSLKASLGSNHEVYIVQDIEARNQLPNVRKADEALVLDASDDPDVSSGWARYIATVDSPTESEWHLIAGGESLDITLDWDSINGKPNSTVAEIDQAVTDSHTHSNKAVLDKITESDGVLAYDGMPIAQGNMVIMSETEPSNQPEGGIWIKPI